MEDTSHFVEINIAEEGNPPEYIMVSPETARRILSGEEKIYRPSFAVVLFFIALAFIGAGLLIYAQYVIGSAQEIRHYEKIELESHQGQGRHYGR